jgi:hypothetical protein
MGKYLGRIHELEQVNVSMGLMGVDLNKFSSSSLVNIAETYGLNTGTIVDFIGTTYNGEAWDFSREDHRQAGRDKVCRSMPILILGTNICSTGVVDWGVQQAHLSFLRELYDYQGGVGKYFIHEQSLCSISWYDGVLATLMNNAGVYHWEGLVDKHGLGKYQAPMPGRGWISNGMGIIQELSKWAVNADDGPYALAKALLRGIRIQLISTGEMGINSVGVEVAEEEHNHQEVLVDEWAKMHDNVTGSLLDNKLVQIARNEELSEIRRRGIYSKVPISQCMQITGKKPIKVRFVDVNKGDEACPNYRSRLVAQEFRDGTPSLFAATPPLEALKTLFSLAVASQGKRQIGFIDIKKAHLYAKATRDVFIELPPGDCMEGMCGKLNYTLYGTRDAAHNWEKEYTGTLQDMGFMVGKSTTCVFRHTGRNIDIVVHGDDFTILGTSWDIQWVHDRLAAKYELKLRGVLGSPLNPGSTSEISVLNRIVRWGGSGIEYEADPRHAEIIISELGLKGSKAVATPGIKCNVFDTAEPLNGREASHYRSLVARANYLAQDRMDIQYAVKELTRRMSTPDSEDWVALKRLGRFLVGKPRVVLQYNNQSIQRYIDCWVDTDWAGCQRTRRSTSGGGLQYGTHTVKTWSTTQAIISLSSAESEYYGLVKGACQLLGIVALFKDFGISVQGRIHIDSSAAKGIASRTGLGKVRHISVHLLWVQERLRNKDFELFKCKGIDNVADLQTKHLSREDNERLSFGWGAVYMEGRSEAMPRCII